MEVLRDFPLKDIIVSEDFKNTVPGADKMQGRRVNCKTAADLEEKIVINDDNVLIDGYVSYLIALENGYERLDVRQGYIELIEASHYTGGNKLLWKVPNRLIGKIEPGNKCYVRTAQGICRVVVNSIVRQQYPQQNPRLRNVLKVSKA